VSVTLTLELNTGGETEEVRAVMAEIPRIGAPIHLDDERYEVQSVVHKLVRDLRPWAGSDRVHRAGSVEVVVYANRRT